MFFRNKLSADGSHASYGLWRVCVTISGNTTCQKYPPCSTDESFCSKLFASRAFVTIACILSILSAIVLFISLATSDKLRSRLLLAGKLLAWICLIVGILGVAIGIHTFTKTQDARIPWGASSIIGVIALVVNAVGAAVSLAAK